MEFAIYAPPAILRDRQDVLDRLQASRPLHAVILRSADATAVEMVAERGIAAWWLAPGLWGAVDVPAEREVELPVVPGWPDAGGDAFEAQWRMLCPTDPALPAELATAYARTARAIGAHGIYLTHLRYHHPANVGQLWGCVCPRCRSLLKEQGLRVADLEAFWRELAAVLRSRPVRSWPEVARDTGKHPLVAWWAAMTDSSIPLRWFAWKNATIQSLISAIAEALKSIDQTMFFATNSFEPLWAPLVGHTPEALQASSWHSPLLGYWPTHVRQSARNLAAWHAYLAGEADVDGVVAALDAIIGADGGLSDPRRALARELQLGAASAAELRQPFWPVLNGTSTADVPLSEAIVLAQQEQAAGVVLQGVSQFLNDPSLDVWY